VPDNETFTCCRDETIVEPLRGTRRRDGLLLGTGRRWRARVSHMVGPGRRVTSDGGRLSCSLAKRHVVRLPNIDR